MRAAVVIGGVGAEGQRRALREGRPLLIATPGRLIDHLDSGTARLDNIEMLVLDEADRMLDMGFAPQLRRVMARLPKQRQTLLFSATMAGEVAEFARTHLRSPVRVEVARSGTMAPRASQAAYRVGQGEKAALLQELLTHSNDSTLVFVRTRRRADKLARSLERAGHRTDRIHADRSQGQRQRALEDFRGGRVRVLVATDIAEDYVHRIGRTARAAASGRASSFVAPDETPLLLAIERLTRTRVPQATVPRDAPAFQAELKQQADRQVDPGPRGPSHGLSSRPSGHAPGRHARTHGTRVFSGGPAGLHPRHNGASHRPRSAGSPQRPRP